MSKTVGKILAVAAVAVAIVAIPPVGAAIGISAATAAIISAGIAAATMVNSAVLASKAKSSLQQRQASVTALQLGEVPREALFGEAMTGGSLVDAFNYGGQYGTDWECQVIALADHRCDALLGFYVNDTYVAFTGNGAVAGYNGQLEVHWQPGAESQAVPAIVTTNGPGWTANDNGAGVCWVAVAYRADKADAKNPIWTAGRPRFTWVVRGARCYQPRLDSTVGGSGPHRWNDPSTWTWTDNPIDCRYNWVRGIYACDRVDQPQQLLVGRGLSLVEAPPANAFAPANVCDELVALDAGGSERRYRVNGVVRADEAFLDVEEHFASACGGVILQPEGAVEIEPGQAKAPVFFFSDEDLLVGSTVEYSETLPDSDAEWVNTVVPRFVDPALKFADHAAPIRRVVGDLITDGGPRELALSLPLVTSATQAGRVGEIQRRLGRLLKRGSVTLGPDFAEVEEGDWGVWTSARYLKGASVMFRVQAYALDEKWHNRLILREISAAVYARDADAASTSVAVQGEDPGPVPQPGPTAWAALGGEIAKGNSAVPVITITGAADNDFADLIRFEVLPAAGVADPAAAAGWIDVGTAGPDARRHLITAVAPVTSYYVAVAYMVGRRPGPRRVLGPVTTLGTRIDFDAVTGPNKPANNATNSADPSSPFGPVGTVADALAVLAKVEPIELDLAGVERATVDHDAAIRQADRARAQLAASGIADLLADHSQRITLRDAGFVVDQASGRAYIYGVDQNDRRVSKVEVDLNAVTSELTLRATYNDVAVAIAQAQLSPGQAAEFGAIIARLNTVEISLASQQAAIALKADAITVQALGVTLQTAVQSIDALNGLVQQRVTYAEFTPFRDKVGEVSQTLSSLGDVSSYGLTIRQAELRNTAAAAAGLAGLLATHEGQQRDVVRAAELQQQFTVSLTEAGAALAATRFALSAQIGEAMAGLVEERSARVTADTAQAKRTDLLTVTLGEQSALLATQGQAIADETGARTLFGQQITARIKAAEDETARVDGRVTAQVARLDTAVADANGARASAVTQLRLEMGDALLLVDDRVDGVVDRTGAIEATRTFAVDANGRVSGWRFVGGANGGRLLLIDADLYLDDGLIVSSAGGFDVRRGAGFGTTGNLIEWFGPTNVALGAETIANSRWALATDGKRYNGGVDLDTIGSAPGRIRQVSVSSNTGTSGTDTKAVDTKQMTLPAGGALRITGRINTASAAPANGDIAGGWVLRFYLDFGSGPALLAEAACSVPTDGSGISVDGLAALAGQLFPNPGSGTATLTVTSQRSPPPNSGIAATWTGSATVEWVNA